MKALKSVRKALGTDAVRILKCENAATGKTITFIFNRVGSRYRLRRALAKPKR